MESPLNARVSDLVVKQELSNRRSGREIAGLLAMAGMTRHDFYRINRWNELAQQVGFRSDSLACGLGISQRQLQRYTAELFGCCPKKWLNVQRLQAAQYLLRETRSVKGVCIELGFKQESHFCRDFKSFFGLSPGKFLAKDDIQSEKFGIVPGQAPLKAFLKENVAFR
jgi:AraC-like DNA-binding protein